MQCMVRASEGLASQLHGRMDMEASTVVLNIEVVFEAKLLSGMIDTPFW